MEVHFVVIVANRKQSNISFFIIMLISYSVLSMYFSGCPSSYYCLIFIHLHGQNWNDRNKVFYYWQGYNYLLIYLSYKEWLCVQQLPIKNLFAGTIHSFRIIQYILFLGSILQCTKELKDNQVCSLPAIRVKSMLHLPSYGWPFIFCIGLVLNSVCGVGQTL